MMIQVPVNQIQMIQDLKPYGSYRMKFSSVTTCHSAVYSAGKKERENKRSGRPSCHLPLYGQKTRITRMENPLAYYHLDYIKRD
jgi:hypothetical protein